MAVQAPSAPSPTAVIVRKPTNLWADAWNRLVRNRAAMVGLVVIIATLLIAIFAPVIAPYDYADTTLTDSNAVPPWLVAVFPQMAPYARISTKYLLGADSLGRDILSRIIWGTRISMSVALIGPFISLFIGVLFGSISGYVGGRTDNLMMRFVDVMYAFPSLLFIILLMTFFRSEPPVEINTAWDAIRSTMFRIDQAFGGMFFIFIGIGFTAWETMARLTRGQVLSVREKEYIEAARTIGARHGRIMQRHILPNILGPLIVAETLAIPAYIATEAFLSFIGIGVKPPTPSWGAMISEGARAVRTYPNQVLFPALALAIIMFAFNFLGDGLRDALDPRMKGTS
jgi:oligopeptide transport system permease protein